MNSIWTECMISLPAPKPIDTHRIANTDGDGNALRVDPTTAKVISMHIGSPQRLMSPTIPPIPNMANIWRTLSFAMVEKR